MITEQLHQKALQALVKKNQDILLECFEKAPLWEWWMKAMVTRNLQLRKALRTLKGSPVGIETNYSESLLSHAVMMQDVEMVGYLLNEGCPATTQNREGRPLISLVCGYNANFEIATLLLKHLNGPLPIETNLYQGTALGSACNNSDPAFIDLLFSHHTPPDPNEIIGENNFVWTFCRNTETLQSMIKHGANLQLVDKEVFWSEISKYQLCYPDVLNFWKTQGLALEFPVKNPLHMACARRSTTLVRWLLENGADPNYLSGCNKEWNWEFPPLYSILGITSNYEDIPSFGEEALEVVRTLLEYGADVSLMFPYTKGKTQVSILERLVYGLDSSEWKYHETLVLEFQSFLNLLRLILSQPQSPILLDHFFKSITGLSSLSMLISESSLAHQVCLLILEKAEELGVWQKADELKDLYWRAMNQGNNLLFEWCLNKNIQIEPQDWQEVGSPLHVAVLNYAKSENSNKEQVYLQMIETLFKSGENPLIKNEKNQTPLELALKIWGSSDSPPWEIDFQKYPKWSALYQLLMSYEEKWTLSETLSLKGNSKTEKFL